MALSLYLWHTAFSLFYFTNSLGGNYDSSVYYISSLDTPIEFGLGTSSIIFLTSIFSSWFNLSYAGVFLVFNLFGYIGLLAYASTLHHLFYTHKKSIRWLVFSMLFLPGLNYWTSSLGKDSLSFLALGLICWSIVSLRFTSYAVLLSFLILLIVRPYIASILLVSFITALIFGLKISYFQKIFAFIFSTLLFYLASFLTFTYIGFSNIPGLEEATFYFSSRSSMNMSGNTSFDLETMALPLRFFSYLFRPLFFDSEGILGIIVSAENLILLVLIFSALLLFFLGFRPFINSFALSFFSIYSFISLFILSNTTANLGLAVRQKWMFLPMILLISVSILFRSPKRL